MMNPAMRQARRASRLAFTILELLTVLSVVALLASLLVPTIVRGKQQLQRTSCQSNLRQIGLGIALYEQDYDQRTLAVSEISRSLWFDSLRPYVKSNQVFRCPSVPEPRLTSSTQPVSDYALNGFYTHSISVDSFQNTSEQIAVSERLRKVDGADYHTWDSNGFFALLNTNQHFNGSNYLFADFHAKWYLWFQTLQPAVRDPTSGLVAGMHNRDSLPRPTTGVAS